MKKILTLSITLILVAGFMSLAKSAEGAITTQGSGNWYSTTPNAPWPGGVVPGPADTVIIDTGHVVTSTAPVTISSVTVTGSLYLDGEGQAVTFTIGNGGELINNGTVQVSSDTYNVTLQAETGGSITFDGNDIDYNGRKIYLARIDYKPGMSLGSSETVELSGSCTFYALTTLPGASFIQGTNNNIYISSNTTLASGTFTKDAGSGKVYFVGDLTLDSSNQNLGQVVIGSSPDTTTLSSDFTADSLTISSGDVFNTKGYEVTVTTDIVINGMLDCTDSPPSNEGDGTVVTLGRGWTKSATGTFTVAGSTVTFTNASSTSTLTGSTTFYALVSTETAKTIKFSSNTITYITGHLNLENVTLRSTLDNATWYLNLSGSGTQDVSGVNVRDSNALEGQKIIAFTSFDSGNNTNWDFGPPEAITDLTGQCDSDTGDVTLCWSTPGDDYNWQNTLDPLEPGEYRIDYSTDSTKQWDKDDYEIQIPTHSIAPHTEASRTITGLTGNSTYYFRIWTRDEVPTNWSGLSNGATVWVNSVLSVTIEPSARPFGTVDAGQSDVLTDGFSVENTGNVTQKYQLRLTGVPTAWMAKSVAGSPEWEQVKILGLFTTQSPLETTHFNDNPPDTGDGDIVRTTTDDQATSTNFAISEEGAEVKGYNVTVGGIRYLWFRFDAPSGTSITNEQFLTVTVTAIQQ